MWGGRTFEDTFVSWPGFDKSVAEGPGDSSVFGGNKENVTPNKKRPFTPSKRNLIPVMVKQLRECEEDTLVVEDVPVNMATILGFVLNVNKSSTKLSVVVDDQTGTIECVLYLGDDDNRRIDFHHFIPSRHSYVRVIGQFRNLRGRKYLNVFDFKPVTDMNELTAHIVEVVYVPMKLKKLKDASEAQAASTALANRVSFTERMEVDPHGTGAGGASTAFAGPSTSWHSMTTLPIVGRRSNGNTFNSSSNGPSSILGIAVIGLIQKCPHPQGLNKYALLYSMGNQITVQQLQTVLSELCTQGLIYCTVDDDHFKATN